VPELSAAPHLGAGAVDLTVSARCSLPITTFEIHATRVAGAATDVGSMGGPLQVVSVTDPPVEDGAPGGSLWTASVSGLPVAEDWRALLIRAVAVPAAADGDTGTYGARSAASPVASVSVPPSAPPDLSALTVDGWGAGDAGVSVQFDSSAPMVVTPYGPHVLTVTARDGAAAASDPPLFSARGPLAAIPIDPTTPPGGADAGVLVRGNRTGGRTPYAAWFVRPNLDTVVAIEVVLSDPLGRVSVRNYQVPSGLLDPPTVTILDARALAGFLLVRFATDAPASDSTGPYTLDVTAAQQRILWPHVPFGRIDLPITDALTPPVPHVGPISPFLPMPPFPPRVVLHAQFSLPDFRTAALDPLQPVDIDAVREGTDGGITTYAVSARMVPPAVVTLAVTTPRGLVGTARATLPGSLP
jgi:hypothetical protein